MEVKAIPWSWQASNPEVTSIDVYWGCDPWGRISWYFTPSVNDASWIWGWIVRNRSLQLTPSATHLLIQPAQWHLSQILHRLLRGAAGTAREGALLWNVNAGHGGLPRDVLIKVETCFCFSAMSAGIFRFHPFASSLCMTLQCCSLKSWVGCKTPDWEVQLTVLEIITRYHDR